MGISMLFESLEGVLSKIIVLAQCSCQLGSNNLLAVLIALSANSLLWQVYDSNIWMGSFSSSCFGVDQQHNWIKHFRYLDMLYYSYSKMNIVLSWLSVKTLKIVVLLLLIQSAVACLKGEQEVRRPWWAPSCLSVVFVRAAKRSRQSRVVSLKLEPWCSPAASDHHTAQFLRHTALQPC